MEGDIDANCKLEGVNWLNQNYGRQIDTNMKVHGRFVIFPNFKEILQKHKRDSSCWLGTSLLSGKDFVRAFLTIHYTTLLMVQRARLKIHKTKHY